MKIINSDIENDPLLAAVAKTNKDYIDIVNGIVIDKRVIDDYNVTGKGITFKPKYPYDDYRYGYAKIDNKCNRIFIDLKHKYNNKLFKTSLARYIYSVYTGKIPTKGMDVDHMDGNKKNDVIENLRLVTREENYAFFKHGSLEKKEALINKIRDLRLEGNSIEKIAEIVGKDKMTVFKYVKDLGINLNKIPKEKIDEIIKLRIKGLSIKEISNILNVSEDAISKYCKKNGLNHINKSKTSFIIYNKLTNIYYMCDSLKTCTIMLNVNYKKFKNDYLRRLLRRNKQLGSNTAKLSLSDYFFYYNTIKVQHDHLEIFYYNKDLIDHNADIKEITEQNVSNCKFRYLLFAETIIGRNILLSNIFTFNDIDKFLKEHNIILDNKDYLSNFEFKENGVRYTIRRMR